MQTTIIHDEQYYNSCIKFAESKNDKSLIECLTQLEKITTNANDRLKNQNSEPDFYKLNIYNDFAPYSFYFVIRNNAGQYLNGGIIYHGKHDNGGDGGAPTYSVNLNPVNGWAIHT